ncbi:MAG: HD domain-containing protein [Deltaproteobacteria bacterium]|jgi:hypothetical protein|nr:HD domain-containing protein [Deltaproteobacteria bacterium]
MRKKSRTPVSDPTLHGRKEGSLALVLEKETQVFTSYTETFYSGDGNLDKHLKLKYAHSLRVLRNAREIAGEEDAFRDNPQARRALLLSALYHDLGRFEQLRRYRTFRDADSVNHGLLGARLLADPRFLVGENADGRKLTRAAVLLHNRLALPPRLPSPLDVVSKALRDADKIDIIRVLQEEFRPGRVPDKTIVLDLPDDPGKYSPKALEELLAGRTVLYSSLGSVNDFRLLLCSWVSGLEFSASRRLLARDGRLETVMESLPRNADMDRARSYVRSRLEEGK